MSPGNRAPVTRWLLAMFGAGALLATVLVALNNRETEPAAAPAEDLPAVSPRVPAPSPSAAPAGQKAQPPCASVIAGMPRRQQLAQLLVVGVEGDRQRVVTQLVTDEQIGGIFIGGNATELLRDNALDQAQQAAKVPVAVAVDEEGGRVQRIDELDGPMDSAREMAAKLSPEQVRELARQRGKQLRARGVTVDYAPIMDVTDRPADDVIGDRSYSADPMRARTYALAFANGLREGGVFPVLKHFPGHGHASGDTHQGTATTPPLEQLRAVDLLPYQRLSDFGESGVMLGHLTVPGLTDGQPASLSEPAYRLLRKDFGFTGLTFTDDLGAMKAITASRSLPVAVLDALRAGADQALWSSGGDVKSVLDRLEAAAGSGELSADRIRDSLTRVLTAKMVCTA